MTLQSDAPSYCNKLFSECWNLESWLLAAGVLIAITAMVLNIDAVLVAHLLLASLVLSEALKLSLNTRLLNRHARSPTLPS